ncbi:hypothetical protein K525DRAFT_186969, partial [Schizophyllum commune Loenen D]
LQDRPCASVAITAHRAPPPAVLRAFPWVSPSLSRHSQAARLGSSAVRVGRALDGVRRSRVHRRRGRAPPDAVLVVGSAIDRATAACLLAAGSRTRAPGAGVRSPGGMMRQMPTRCCCCNLSQVWRRARGAGVEAEPCAGSAVYRREVGLLSRRRVLGKGQGKRDAGLCASRIFAARCQVCSQGERGYV